MEHLDNEMDHCSAKRAIFITQDEWVSWDAVEQTQEEISRTRRPDPV
jgi:hypothetical protein